MLRYQSAIGNDSPFREARKIKKNINRLKTLLAQQERACPQ
jgi:ribosomal protein L29